MSNSKLGSETEKIDDYQLDVAPRRPSVVGNLSVDNPLQRYSPDKIAQDAREFCRQKGLDEYSELFANAALVARDPQMYASIPHLPDDQRDALDHERKNKWAGTWMLYFTMLVCALGAACQGWDQTGSNGANLSFPLEFGLAHPPAPDAAAVESRSVGGLWSLATHLLKRAGAVNTGGAAPGKNDWIVGAINGAPYMSAAIPGVWISDPLNHFFGRRGEIFITAIILIITPIASGFSRNWGQLLAIRLLMGIGIGAKAATVPVYAAEMAPTAIRGALTMGWQLWVCFGIFLGFAANVIVKDVPRIAWRLQLGSAFIPALPLAIFIFFSPESPRWLMKKGRYPQAFKSMLRLRKAPIIAARDLYYSHVLYEEEREEAAGSSYISRLIDCFTIPRIRRANVAASTVMLSQQLCGINIIAFYSSTVFKEGGASENQALYASLGFGALNFAFAIPAIFTIDTFGRRSLLLATFPFMAITLLGCGLSFLMPTEPASTRTGVIAMWIYLFTAFYSVGEGPVCFLYGAEVFPTIQREQGMAWAVFINMFFASILGITFPAMKTALTPVGAFCFYAGLNVLSFFLIFFLVPETKALTLEELDDVFNVPTAQFAKYQTSKWLPWFIKKHLLCGGSRVAPLEPLHVTHKQRVDSP